VGVRYVEEESAGRSLTPQSLVVSTLTARFNTEKDIFPTKRISLPYDSYGYFCIDHKGYSLICLPKGSLMCSS
jgi:hypothetical protein